MEMKNREQRRREKFGRAGKVHQHDPTGPWPQSEANPALRTGPAEPTASDGDVTTAGEESRVDEGRKTRAKPKV
jgi:hypothetical protein